MGKDKEDKLVEDKVEETNDINTVKSVVETVKKTIVPQKSKTSQKKPVRRVRKGINDAGQWEWETIYE